MGLDLADVEVLVLGAGMAGLSAARSLAVLGFSVLVLEAQGRIGGRILTQRVGDEVIELGAEFVHGQPPELLALIEEASLILVERTGSLVRHRGGRLIAEIGSAEMNDPFSLLEQLEDRSGAELSFAEFLDVAEVSEEERDAAVGFVEGFNAADHRVISASALGLQQKAEDAIEGHRSFHVHGGYDQLPEFLARKVEKHGGEMRLDTRVDRIEWQSGKVVARTNQGSFSARRVVIAIPLGVLQSGAVTFEPELPRDFSAIFARTGPIRMRSAIRFTLIFRARFWTELPPQPAMSELSFLIGMAAVPPVWWTPHPETSNALTGWVGGPRTAQLAGLSAEALAERGCKALAVLFGLDVTYIRGLLTGCFMHDWSVDSHAQGAYSYIAKGGVEAPGVLASPVSETLYFAGEHTATDGHWGTVHAALASGRRAASQIAAAANDGTNTKRPIAW